MKDQLNQKDSQGEQHGLWESYWGNGTLRWKGYYHHGELHGVWVAYYENGTPVRRETYLHGNPHGLWEYRPDGIPCYKEYYLAIK
jgi:antitoxin component YwqK of YwqJK toxin-antitoxin module